jgi:hypothetical protein
MSCRRVSDRSANSDQLFVHGTVQPCVKSLALEAGLRAGKAMRCARSVVCSDLGRDEHLRGSACS